MAKIIDNVILNTLLFAIFTVWATYLTQNLTYGILISAILVLLLAILTKPNNDKKINPDGYIPKFVTMTNQQLNELIFATLTPQTSPVIKRGNVILNSNTLLLPHLKFSKISADDIYGKARKAKFSGFKKLILLVNEYDETAFDKIKQYLPVQVEILDVRSLILSLDKANLLPSIPLSTKKVKPKFTALLKTAVKRKNFKYFLLSGLSLLLLSFVTPLKLYYLTFSTISLSFAILCVLKRKAKKTSYFI